MGGGSTKARRCVVLTQAEVPNEFVDEVARAVVERVIELIETRAAENEYMDVARAAAYLSCSKGRLFQPC